MTLIFAGWLEFVGVTSSIGKCVTDGDGDGVALGDVEGDDDGDVDVELLGVAEGDPAGV